jgi:hypothetical protein
MNLHVFGHNNKDFRPSLFLDVMQCMQGASNLANTKSIVNFHKFTKILTMLVNGNLNMEKACSTNDVSL